MKVNGTPYQTIWLQTDDPSIVCVIDQRFLPHKFQIKQLTSVSDCVVAISDMVVRGAPLIGVTAGFGIYLASLKTASAARAHDLKICFREAADRLMASRPTAVNLRWALEQQLEIVGHFLDAHEDNAIVPDADVKHLIDSLRKNAVALAAHEAEIGYRIGQCGLELIRKIASEKSGRAINILTHCNAGWLCTVDWGTATSPIYQAFNEGFKIHVWVDETRPRNQGASLTAWELGQHGVPYTVITDNAGGHLMQHGKVDLVLVGTDRVTRRGDVANKIGTYLKALAANDNGIPFYVAAPSSSIDWAIVSSSEIPIEERDADEVRYVSGLDDSGVINRVLVTPENARVSNFGFDVTPARLITGIITERGFAMASEGALLALFPEKASVTVR